MRIATVKPEATLPTAGYLDNRSQRWNCRMRGDKTTLQNLSRCSKKHQRKEQFLKDLSQKQTISRFSEESQQKLADMNHTEIFELHENSAKQQCPDCNAFFEIGFIYCSCGRNLKYSRSPTTAQKTNYDFPSIPGFVVKKNSSRGPKHGASEKQIMLCKAKQMLQKARQGKHGKLPTILSRWYADTDYRSSFRSTTLAKKKSCFSIASLLKDMTIRLRKLNGCRTPNIGSFVWMLMGTRNLFDSDQKLPLHQNNASKCKMLTWRTGGNL